MFAFRASREGDLAPAFGSVQPLAAPERPGLAPAAGSAHESPPAHASPASHTRGSTPAPFWISRDPRASGRSSELCPSRPQHRGCGEPARVTAQRPGPGTSCRPGTNGCGDTGRKERRSGRIKAGPGIGFLSAQQELRSQG